MVLFLPNHCSFLSGPYPSHQFSRKSWKLSLTPINILSPLTRLFTDSELVLFHFPSYWNQIILFYLFLSTTVLISAYSFYFAQHWFLVFLSDSAFSSRFLFILSNAHHLYTTIVPFSSMMAFSATVTIPEYRTTGP